MNRTYDDTMFRENFEHQYTWLNGFMRNSRRYSKRPAMFDPATDRSWTYSELDAETNRFAHALREDGIGKNDVVMGILMNCPEFTFTYLAPRKIGAIFNPTNFNLSAGEMALLIEHNKPKAVIYSAEVVKMAAKAIEMSSFKPSRIIMADNLKNIPVPEGHISYEEYISGKSSTLPEMDFIPHIYDEVVRMCTSGTTSLPKSVPINDINEVLTAHDFIMHFEMNRKSVSMNLTPWFHRGGCHIGGACPTLYAGGAVVVMRNFSPHSALKWVEKYGITHIIGAPASVEMLCRIQERNSVDVSSLHALVSMGAPLEEEACKRYMKYLTPNIYNGYGTTESFCNNYLRPYDLPEGAGSVGASCIDDEVRVVKVYPDKKAEPDEIVPTDEETVGEVIIWSPAKTTYSYYENPEMTEEKFYKGWMYTGDLATWNDEWYVTVNGRKDDMIVCSGENIYPAQIEEVLSSFDRIDDSIVTCIPDEIRGEAVVAYIKAKDTELTEKDVAAFCRKSNHLSSYKCPRWYRIVDELPHTATGKKMHYIMKEQAVKDLEKGLLIRG